MNCLKHPTRLKDIISSAPFLDIFAYPDNLSRQTFKFFTFQKMINFLLFFNFLCVTFGQSPDLVGDFISRTQLDEEDALSSYTSLQSEEIDNFLGNLRSNTIKISY